jgi:hypothetical protein
VGRVGLAGLLQHLEAWTKMKIAGPIGFVFLILGFALQLVGTFLGAR